MIELKAFRIKEVEDGCPFWQAEYEVYSKQEADKELRRLKYKRCLNMAKWCKYWANYWKCCEPPDCSLFIAKAKYYRKWQKRWLKIAEQFKEDA